MCNNNEDILKNCDHILEQPLLTEDGFINPACMNELESAIKNMPNTYERLAGDLEWSTPRWVFWRHIVGALAMWAVRQIPCETSNWETMKNEPLDAPVYPPGLEKIIGYVGTCIKPKFDSHGMAELSLCQINKMLHDILMDQGISIFDGWNTPEVMGKGWLDLHALLHNVCLTIRDERRAHDKFDAEFEAKYGELT